jgi:hypothetical protein
MPLRKASSGEPLISQYIVTCQVKISIYSAFFGFVLKLTEGLSIRPAVLFKDFMACFFLPRRLNKTMHVEQNPIHRKIIVSWYDSDPAIIALMAAMALVLIFGIFGIVVSHEAQEYNADGWIAMLLTGLSGWVILSAGIRLISRLIRQQD